MARSSILVLVSGGVDSTACLHYYLEREKSPQALFINYGQAASGPEGAAAVRIAGHYKVSLTQLKLSGCCDKSPGLVRGRNAYLALAALLELPAGLTSIALAIHSGTPYWDCSSEFVNTIQGLFDAYTDGKVRLRVPFLRWSKGQILRYCLERQVPLSLTYSCEAGVSPPCGDCPSCRDWEAARVL